MNLLRHRSTHYCDGYLKTAGRETCPLCKEDAYKSLHTDRASQSTNPSPYHSSVGNGDCLHGRRRHDSILVSTRKRCHEHVGRSVSVAIKVCRRITSPTNSDLSESEQRTNTEIIVVHFGSQECARRCVISKGAPNGNFKTIT